MRIFFVISLYTGLRQRRDWSASARPIRVVDGDRGRVPGRETDFFKATFYTLVFSVQKMFKFNRLPFVNYVILLILCIYSYISFL